MFDTSVGTCGMMWTAQFISRFNLPEVTLEATRERLLRSVSAVEAEPVGLALDARDGVLALLETGSADLSTIPVSFGALSPFDISVLETIRSLAPGQTTTYGDIARELGDVALSQAVGAALGRNPVPVIVPCHRVLAANGKLGGFSGGQGLPTKRRLLEIERARTAHERMQPDLFD
jgi:methylated-DNA-[protein]-cysteine S-methyltransferase